MGVWLPDSHFLQAKKGKYSQVAKDGQTIKVKKNGDVSHGTRLVFIFENTTLIKLFI